MTLRLCPPDRYARAALVRECDEVARTTNGRNARLNRAAFALGGLAGAGHLAESEIENALFNAAITCGYVAKDGPRQARDTIRSGLKRGALDPRDPPAQGEGHPLERPDPRELARFDRLRERQMLARETEAKIKAERVRRIWGAADPDPRGKLPDRYFTEHRGIELLPSVCGHAIRFAAAGPWEGELAPMMIAAFRDFATNSITGLHRTKLDAVTAQKTARKMLGRVAGSAIKLSRDSEVGSGLIVAEGIETAIAGMMVGLLPMWALGSAGAIRTLPPLSGVESLTICAEYDDGGANAAAIEEVGNRWCDAGREVFVATPKTGADINDAIQGAVR